MEQLFMVRKNAKNVINFSPFPVANHKRHNFRDEFQSDSSSTRFQLLYFDYKKESNQCLDNSTVFKNHRKKSHSTLRAKRATFTFLVDKSLVKMPKIVNF